MILTDYFRVNPDFTWDIALQCGVKHGVVRMPEDSTFDVTSLAHLREITDRFRARGIKPLIVEPLPNALHDHIKTGDFKRDECIEKFIAFMRNLHEEGFTTVCFNFMAYYGWTRTATDLVDRGGAQVTGFSLKDFHGDDFSLSESQLWKNYEYFIAAVLPYAEKYNIHLALHPDDPPLPKLGNVARIFTNVNAIKRAMSVVNSSNLGLTFCQACYYLMGCDMERTIAEFADKIKFIHFRNVTGNKMNFRETFHDNGDLDMAKMVRLYKKHNIDVPIRADHVPTMKGETSKVSGYDALGRLFAVGYLKGLLEGADLEIR